MALSEAKKAEMRRVIESSKQKTQAQTNVSADKVEELKQYRDFEPTAEMTKGQQFAGGFQKGHYKNIEEEPTWLSKFARKASDIAPTAGSTVAGTIGRVLGRKSGAVASGAGYGAGLALGESLENIAGIQDETPAELAKEAIAEPLAVGAADYAIDYGVDKLGKAIKPFKDKVVKSGSKLLDTFMPKRREVFKSIFTVPRKIASRLNLDGMSDKMIEYDIKGGLDDYEKVASKVTGSNGTMTKAVRDVLGNVETPVNTGEALNIAQKAADDALNLDDNVIKKTLRKVTNMVSKSQGDLPGRNTAIDVWDTVQALEKEGYNLMGKSTDMTPRIDMEQQGQIFLAAADSLKDQIDNSVVSEGIMDSIKKKYASKIAEISPKLAEEFMQTNNIREIRSLAKPFVDLSTATKLTRDAGSSVMSKFITGQNTGAQSISLNKPLTWFNPILQKPEVKSWISQQGKNFKNPITSKAVSTAKDIAKVGRRGLTSLGVDQTNK